ncbi:hypothetical protein Holit_02408 [Hollandina sp. SP2]
MQRTGKRFMEKRKAEKMVLFNMYNNHLVIDFIYNRKKHILELLFEGLIMNPYSISIIGAAVLLLCSGLFIFVFTPINYLASQWKRIIIKLFRIRSDNNVTEAELLTFVEEVRQAGGINEGQKHMIRNAIEFDDLTVNDIFTPRVDLTAVSIIDTVDSIEKRFYGIEYSRLPVHLIPLIIVPE